MLLLPHVFCSLSDKPLTSLVIGGEMGEHERELHGGESLKLKTKKKKQQSAQSSDSDDHKPPPW